MKRRLFNLATMISLLVFMAMAVVGIRSYWVGDMWRSDSKPILNRDLNFDAKTIVWGSAHGAVYLDAVDFQGDGVFSRQPGIDYHPQRGPTYPHLSNFKGSRGWEVCGTVYGVSTYTFPNGGVKARFLVIPAAVPFVVFGLLPAVWIRRRQKSRRICYRLTHGLCLRCGYDLRATPGRCPECGYVQTVEENPKAECRNNSEIRIPE